MKSLQSPKPTHPASHVGFMKNHYQGVRVSDSLTLTSTLPYPTSPTAHMSFNALFCEADPPITTSKGLAGAFTAKDMTKARWPCLTNNGWARMCSKMYEDAGILPPQKKMNLKIDDWTMTFLWIEMVPFHGTCEFAEVYCCWNFIRNKSLIDVGWTIRIDNLSGTGFSYIKSSI